MRTESSYSTAYTALALICLVAPTGCMTTYTLKSAATEPRPRAYHAANTIQRAAVYGDELHLQLGTSVESPPLKPQPPLFVTVMLSEVQRGLMRAAEPPKGLLTAFQRLPVRPTHADGFPESAVLVPVRQLQLDQWSDLTTQIESLSAEPQVLIVSQRHEWVDGGLGHQHVERDAFGYGVIVALILPETPGGPLVVVAHDFEVRPRYRRWLFVLAPLALATDIVTAPIQIIALLALGD